MKVAKSDLDLSDAYESARLESKAAFGSNIVYIEKYLNNPRHIEIQIMADNYGNVVHLGERECSIQRRHQKIIAANLQVRVSSLESSTSVAAPGVPGGGLGSLARYGVGKKITGLLRT